MSAWGASQDTLLRLLELPFQPPLSPARSRPSSASTPGSPAAMPLAAAQGQSQGLSQGLSSSPQAATSLEVERARLRELDGKWNDSQREAEHRGLPLVYCAAASNDVHSELAHIIRGADAFYVGSTQDPIWRWLGGRAVPDDPFTASRGAMPGHCICWTSLHVLDLLDGPGAAALETRLIIWAKGQWPEKCMNRALDARGLDRGVPGFVYVVTK